MPGIGVIHEAAEGQGHDAMPSGCSTSTAFGVLSTNTRSMGRTPRLQEGPVHLKIDAQCFFEVLQQGRDGFASNWAPFPNAPILTMRTAGRGPL